MSLKLVVTCLVNLSHDHRGARIDFGHDVAQVGHLRTGEYHHEHRPFDASVASTRKQLGAAPSQAETADGSAPECAQKQVAVAQYRKRSRQQVGCQGGCHHADD